MGSGVVPPVVNRGIEIGLRLLFLRREGAPEGDARAFALSQLEGKGEGDVKQGVGVVAVRPAADARVAGQAGGGDALEEWREFPARVVRPAGGPFGMVEAV